MTGKSLNAAIRLLAAVACALPLVAHAQQAASPAGTYCLVGVREVGSCMRLSADGTFEYFLAYGAYDENSEGRWRLEGGDIVVDSRPYDNRPTFTFKRMQRSDSDAFDIIVESTAGRKIQGIDVKATCDGRTVDVGTTGAGGYKVDCVQAPVDVSLGLEMYALTYQTIDVSARAGADKAYVFEFNPGDLGKKRFLATRLRPRGNALTMTYADSPIRELEGRTFEYVRE